MAVTPQAVTRVEQLGMLVAAAATGAAVGLVSVSVCRAGGDHGRGVESVAATETIAFVDYLDSYNPGVFTVQSDRTHRRLLIAGLEAPAWSPDGRRIAAVDQIVTIYDAGCENGRDLLGGVCDEPAWSPDGRQIACVGPTDDRMSNISNKPGLWLENAKTGSEKLLPVAVDWYASPTWSPDGNRVARHTVVSSKTMWLGHPSWSPDGTRIVYAVFAGKPAKSRGLRVVNADGGQARILTHSGFDPDWKPR